MTKAYSKTDIEKRAGKKLTDIESKQVMLEMMEAFDAFCHAHGLKYWLSYGTLIGAVRHQGFIPWDDDADLVMPRKDYNELIKFSKISDHIEIVSVQNPLNYYHPFPYSKLTDTSTISIIKKSNRNTGRGQFIDVFPLDNVPDNEKERKQFLDKIRRYQRLRTLAVRKYKPGKGIRNLMTNAITLTMRPLSGIFLMRKIDRISQEYNNTDTKQWGIVCFSTKHTCIHNKSDFKETVRTRFEGKTLDIPAGYDSILRGSYGDYMELPPAEQRIPKHDAEIFWKKV